MRIISGKYRGRKFYPENHFPTRPTTDFAKEGLFNVLSNNWDFEDINYLDLFCGTGSISYEFASRGCEDITSVDKYPGCIKFVEDTCAKLGIECIQTFNTDVLKFIQNSNKEYNIIFAGPPYAFPKIPDLPDMIIDKGLLKTGGWFILEHAPDHNFEDHPKLLTVRNYSKTIFSIFTTK